MPRADFIAVYGSDEGNAVGTVISALSFHRTNPTVPIAVIADRWSRSSLSRLQALLPEGILRIIDASDLARHFPTGEAHISPGAFLRLLIPEVIDDHDVALYLDADTLVRHDLSADLVGFTSGAEASTAGVRDFGVPCIGSPGGVRDWRQNSIDPRAPHINSGVMMIRLGRWRDERIGSRALAFARRHRCLDQPAINAVLNGDVTLLPPRLNATVHMLRDPDVACTEYPREEMDEAISDPSIVHFTGFIKPWHTDSRTPFLEEWREVASHCGPMRLRSAFSRRTRVLQHIRGWADRAAWAQPSRTADFVA